MARACILSAKAPVTDRVYNVGTGVETSLLDLARIMAAEFGRSDLVPEHQPERGVNPVPRRLASCAAAADELGFRPAHDLDAGVAAFAEWMRANPERWGG